MQWVEQWFTPGDPLGFFDGADGHAFQFHTQRTCQMRCEQHVWMGVETRIRREHPRGGDIQDGVKVALLDTSKQRVLVYQFAPGCVDERGSRLEAGHQALVDQVAGGRERRRVEADDVGTRHELFQRNTFDAEISCRGIVQEGIGYHYLDVR